jgi:hypothetical protein
VDDFSALFGEDPIFRQFEEIPGESEERRKARWDREQRTKSRVVCLVMLVFFESSSTILVLENIASYSKVYLSSLENLLNQLKHISNVRSFHI